MKRNLFFGILLYMAFFIFMGVSSVTAQYWTVMPPYNVLWPLWSPVLSPPNPKTGLPTPIVDHLASDTILPTIWDPVLQQDITVQPVIAWDPGLPYPYLFYNGLEGPLYYYPENRGLLRPWPPAPFGPVDFVSGAIIPPGGINLSLFPGYEFFPPTDYEILYSSYLNANSGWILLGSWSDFFSTNPISFINFLDLAGLSLDEFLALPFIAPWLPIIQSW